MLSFASSQDGRVSVAKVTKAESRMNESIANRNGHAPGAKFARTCSSKDRAESTRKAVTSLHPVIEDKPDTTCHHLALARTVTVIVELWKSLPLQLTL
jgi:hypothetical protein